jgi:N-acetylglutamate synthase-like GNAT family acetyltransferase
MLKMIRQAVKEDLGSIVEMLEKAGLSTEGVEEAIESFLVVEDGKENLIGTLGVEIQNRTGLLRSLVITKELGGDDLFSLFQEVLKLSKERGLEKLFLISNRKASVDFFHLLGFAEAKEGDVEDLAEFTHAQKLSTVDECVVMKLIF